MDQLNLNKNLCFRTFKRQTTKIEIPRGGCSFNTDYVKVPIFPDFVDNLCKYMVCIRP